MTAAVSVAGFVWDPRLAAHVYRADHPLKPRRLRGVHDTLVRLGAFSHPNARLLAPRDATRAELERVHDGAYVDAVAQASADPDLDYAEWGLHTFGDTPPFAGMHEASLLTTGASLVAMEAVVSGRAPFAVYNCARVHHPERPLQSQSFSYQQPPELYGHLADHHEHNLR